MSSAMRERENHILSGLTRHLIQRPSLFFVPQSGVKSTVDKTKATSRPLMPVLFISVSFGNIYALYRHRVQLLTEYVRLGQIFALLTWPK